MIKKILLTFAIMTTALFSISQIAQAQTIPDSSFHVGTTKGSVSYPTEITVYNYHTDPSNFIKVELLGTPYPVKILYPSTIPYYVYNDKYQMIVSVIVKDRWDNIIVNPVPVGHHVTVKVFDSKESNGKPEVSVS